MALADIAERQDISLSYLEQLFAKLRRGGLVTSVRGPGGGYRLSRPSAELRIADIIVAVDEPIAATRCKTGSAKGCTKTGARCVTHDLWEELGQQIHVFLSSVSLADVVEKRVLGRARPCNDVGDAEKSRSGLSTPCIICDHNATSPLRPEAGTRCCARWPSAAIRRRCMRRAARRARWSKRRASRWPRWSGAKPEQVIFTSGATESNALALAGAVEGALTNGDKPSASPACSFPPSSIVRCCKTAAALAERAPGCGSNSFPSPRTAWWIPKRCACCCAKARAAPWSR